MSDPGAFGPAYEEVPDERGPGVATRLAQRALTPQETTAPQIQIDHERRRDWVALCLSISVAFALNVVVLAVFWQAIVNGTPISDNATQVLTGAFGGMLGILGAFLGFRAGAEAGATRATISGSPVGDVTLGQGQTKLAPAAPEPPEPPESP